MAHTTRDKKKLLMRVRRLRGQIEAIERGLEEERDCSEVLQNVAACRGALNSLMAEIIEGHVRCHIVVRGNSSEHNDAAEDLIGIVRSYLK